MGVSLAFLAAGFGAALTIIGAAFGISKIAQAALDGGARQPEVVGHLRISMIIAAALIEGLGFFALVVCLLLATKEVPKVDDAKGHAMVKPPVRAPAVPGKIG
jgi:F-type H+-transporting ATPase subunit c